jgi:hypothetical protein
MLLTQLWDEPHLFLQRQENGSLNPNFLKMITSDEDEANHPVPYNRVSDTTRG